MSQRAFKTKKKCPRCLMWREAHGGVIQIHRCPHGSPCATPHPQTGKLLCADCNRKTGRSPAGAP